MKRLFCILAILTLLCLTLAVFVFAAEDQSNPFSSEGGITFIQNDRLIMNVIPPSLENGFD